MYNVIVVVKARTPPTNIHTLERAQLILTLLVGVILNAHCIERYSWIPSTPNPIAPKFDFFGIVSIRYNENKVSV